MALITVLLVNDEQLALENVYEIVNLARSLDPTRINTDNTGCGAKLLNP